MKHEPKERFIPRSHLDTIAAVDAFLKLKCEVGKNHKWGMDNFCQRCGVFAPDVYAKKRATSRRLQKLKGNGCCPPLTLATCSAAWLPIQLAPKDGTRVILWCGDEIEIGYWSISSWVLRSEGSPMGKQDGAWILSENRNDTIELTPTHWQPLPMPPNVKS